jgi:hypothetical protein
VAAFSKNGRDSGLSGDMRRTIVILATGAMFAGIVWVANRTAQKGYLGEHARLGAQMLAPMRDLYTNILEQPISVAVGGRRFQYRFSNRYAGRHVFGLLARRDIELAPISSYSQRLAISISCGVEKSILFEKERQETFYPLWRPMDHRQGFALFTYMVPQDLPLGRVVNCDVTINEGDEEFANRYGIYAFYAEKQSED